MDRASILDQLRQKGIPVDDPSISGKSDAELQALLASVNQSGFSSAWKGKNFSAFAADGCDPKDAKLADKMAAKARVYAAIPGEFLNPSKDAATGDNAVDTLTPIEQQNKVKMSDDSDPNAQPGYMKAFADVAADQQAPPWAKTMAAGCKAMAAKFTADLGATSAAVKGVEQKTGAQEMAQFNAALDEAIVKRGAIAPNQKEIYLKAARETQQEAKATPVLMSGAFSGLTPLAALTSQIQGMPANPHFVEHLESNTADDKGNDAWAEKALKHLPEFREPAYAPTKK